MAIEGKNKNSIGSGLKERIIATFVGHALFLSKFISGDITAISNQHRNTAIQIQNGLKREIKESRLIVTVADFDIIAHDFPCCHALDNLLNTLPCPVVMCPVLKIPEVSTYGFFGTQAKKFKTLFIQFDDFATHIQD